MAEMMMAQEAVADKLKQTSDEIWLDKGQMEAAYRTSSSARCQPIVNVVEPRAVMSSWPALKEVGIVRRLSVFTVSKLGVS